MIRRSIIKQEVSEGWQDEGSEENTNRTEYKGLIVSFVLIYGVELHVLHIHTAGK